MEPGEADELRSEGRPVFIDFSAAVVPDLPGERAAGALQPSVRERFRELGVALLRADWTDRSDRIAAAIAGYGRAGVPLYVLYAPGAEQPMLLPELLTPASCSMPGQPLEPVSPPLVDPPCCPLYYLILLQEVSP